MNRHGASDVRVEGYLSPCGTRVSVAPGGPPASIEIAGVPAALAASLMGKRVVVDGRLTGQLCEAQAISLAPSQDLHAIPAPPSDARRAPAHDAPPPLPAPVASGGTWLPGLPHAEQPYQWELYEWHEDAQAARTHKPTVGTAALIAPLGTAGLVDSPDLTPLPEPIPATPLSQGDVAHGRGYVQVRDDTFWLADHWGAAPESGVRLAWNKSAPWDGLANELGSSAPYTVYALEGTWQGDHLAVTEVTVPGRQDWTLALRRPVLPVYAGPEDGDPEGDGPRTTAQLSLDFALLVAHPGEQFVW